MGNDSSNINMNNSSNTYASVNVCFADCEIVFNMQQNTFSNYMLLDIRSKTEYNKSHIDQSHHVKFAKQLSCIKNDKNKQQQSLHKKWLKQLVKLHQASFSKSKIQFYIVNDNDNDMSSVMNVCNWLSNLYHDTEDNIPQIDTSSYFYVNFTKYNTLYNFMCSDHAYYDEGRLFPSHITDNIYLSNWGIASDGYCFKILKDIKYVINCTRDHPNIYNIYNESNDIYSGDFLKEINEENAMFMNQKNKIKQLREEFNDVRLNYMRVPIVDNAQNDIFQYFESCCKFIQSAMMNNDNNKILIHCRHGASRSVSIVASWLIYNKQMSVEQSLQFIKRKRPRCHPNQGFIQQLHAWSVRCKETTNDK